MCQTSELGEKLCSPAELVPVGLNIGRRILEVFGYERISNLVFRLRTPRRDIEAVIRGERLPSTELLLGIHKITGASIDWILTGRGSKYLPFWSNRSADAALVEVPDGISLPTEDPAENLRIDGLMV